MLRKRPRPAVGGFTLVLIGAALWGSNGVTGALVATNSQMSWAAIVALRMTIGGLVMLALTVLTGELRRMRNDRATWRTIVLTALAAVVFAGGYFQSLAYIGVAVATVVTIGTSSLVLTVAGTVRDRRWPGPGVTCALLASMVGLVMVCSSGDDGVAPVDARSFWIGIGLAAISGIAFGAQTLVNSEPEPGLSPKVLVGLSFTIAGALSMPWAAVQGFGLDTMTPTAWVAMGLLTLLSTLLGFFAYFAGLHRGVPPTTAAVSTAIEPVVAGVLAVLVLGERLTGVTIAGMALILAGVLLVRPRDERAVELVLPGPE